MCIFRSKTKEYGDGGTFSGFIVPHEVIYGSKKFEHRVRVEKKTIRRHENVDIALQSFQYGLLSSGSFPVNFKMFLSRGRDIIIIGRKTFKTGYVR